MKKKHKFEFELYTSFTFTYRENATNVMLALGQAGYLVNCKKIGEVYQVDVYQHFTN